MKLKKFILLPLFILTMTFFGCQGAKIITDGATEYHHIFPQQFKEQFAKKGINVDRFTIALTQKDHRGMGKGLQYVPTNWNNEWNNWLLKNPNFTQQEAAEKAKEMLYNAGCRGEFKFFDFNTHKLTNASIGGYTGLFICSNNVFLKMCSKIGYFFLKLFNGSTIGGQILAFLASIGSFILGLFGIKSEEPVAIGVGIITVIVGILAIIGVIIFVKWIIGLLVVGGSASGIIAANS